MTPEGKVKNKVRQLLFKYGVYFFTPATGGYGRSGVPDIVGCMNGRFFAIECKAGDNELTPLQSDEINTIWLHKGVAFVIHGDKLEVLETWLAEQSKLNDMYAPCEVMTVPRRLAKRIRMPVHDNLND